MYGAYNILADNQIFGWALILGGAVVPFFYAPNNWYVAYEGKLNFRSSTVRIILSQIVLLFSLVSGLFFGASLPILVLLYFFSQAFFTVFFYLEVVKKIEKKVEKSL